VGDGVGVAVGTGVWKCGDAVGQTLAEGVGQLDGVGDGDGVEFRAPRSWDTGSLVGVGDGEPDAVGVALGDAEGHGLGHGVVDGVGDALGLGLASRPVMGLLLAVADGVGVDEELGLGETRAVVWGDAQGVAASTTARPARASTPAASTKTRGAARCRRSIVVSLLFVNSAGEERPPRASPGLRVGQRIPYPDGS
jgi:hypothetical protein